MGSSKQSGVEQLIDQFLQRGIDTMRQPLDARTAGGVGRDLIDIIRFHAAIPHLLRIEDQIGSRLAGAEAHVRLHFDIAGILQSPGQFFKQFAGTARFTIGVLTDENVARNHRLHRQYPVVLFEDVREPGLVPGIRQNLFKVTRILLGRE